MKQRMHKNMANEKIIIDIDKGGGTRVSVEGVQGDACTLFSKRIVDALGAVESDTPTDEMYEVPNEAHLEHTA